MPVNIAATTQRMDAQAAQLDSEAAGHFDKARALIAEAQAEADKHLADARERARVIAEQGQGAQDEAEYWRGLAARERKDANLMPAPQPAPPQEAKGLDDDQPTPAGPDCPGCVSFGGTPQGCPAHGHDYADAGDDPKAGA